MSNLENIVDTKAAPEINNGAELNHELRSHSGFELRDRQGFFATVSLLWCSRRQIWHFVVAGFVLGVLIAFIIPPEYSSTTQLMPPDPQSGMGMSMLSSFASAATGGSSTGSDLASMASGMLGFKTPGDLFVGVLGSRTVVDAIINRFDLRKEYRLKTYEATRKRLAKNTELAMDHKSGIIAITVYDHDKRRAADIAREYVVQLDRTMAVVSTSAARRERIFLEGRLGLAKQELDSATKDLGEYSSKNATVDVENEGKAIVEAAATLQGELIAAQSEVKGLEQIYTSNNVRVKTLQARIAELESKLREIGGSKGVSIGSVGENDSTQNNGTDDFLVPSLRQLPILGEGYIDRYRRAKIAEKIFEFLTTQYEMARVQEAKEIPSVKVLDAAVVPERKSSPPRVALIIIFTVFAGLTGMVWVVGNRKWNELDAYSPLRLVVLEIARDISSTRAWKKSEVLFQHVKGRFRENRLFRLRKNGGFPGE